MYQKSRKIIASMLVVMLMMSHISIIGEVLATSIENQKTTTNQTNVEFDAYFDAKKHETTKNIGEENFLTSEITVKNAGYLKDATLEVQDANFEIIEVQNEQISKTEGNKVYFNQVKNGETAQIAIPIRMISKDSIKLEELSKISKINFNAVYVDGNGKEKEVKKEIEVKLAWAAKDAQVDFNVQIAKFVPYQIKDNKGLVLQTIVQSNIKDNSMPVKTNNIEIEIPKINKISPEEVKVIANSTSATNGDSTGVDFKDENYKVEDGKLTITVENEKNDNEEISWIKDVKDEFVVTYKYPEEALKSISEDGVKISIKANNEVVAYNAENSKLQKDFEGEITLKDQISNLVDFYIVSSADSISKGQMYANYNVENKIDTEYKQTITANVGLAELTDKIIIEQAQDRFVVNDETKNDIQQSYIKEIKMDKKEIEKILGEDGEITISSGKTQIAKINKDSEEKDFTIDLSELNVNNLKIETSKPIIEGKLNFILTKVIKGETEFTRNQIQDFNKLELNIIGKAESDGEIFVEQSAKKEITLTEPTLQAELQIENSNLSTIVTNQNVKIKAILKTDTLDCMLYQNPTLKITLPSYIENINAKNVEVLFDKEGSKLNIKTAELHQNEDGTKTIFIALEGTQFEYSLGTVSKGVNVIITADMTLNKLTPNRQDEITMECTNNTAKEVSQTRMLRSLRSSANTNQQTITVGAKLNTVAPVGVITISQISNYRDNAETIEVMNGEEKTATIPTLVDARTADLKMNVVNNYNNTINNVSILGRLMFKGNKDILTSKDLGSTFTTKLSGPITVTGIEPDKYAVYYSENENATNDVNLEANSWVMQPANYENIKSYLIVLANSYELETGKNIEFNYKAIIPAGLQHNESAYQDYVVYFNNNLSTGTVADKQQATKLGITTGTGPIIEANISSNTNKELQQGDVATYTLTVKNKGTETAKNVMTKLIIPKGLELVERDVETSSDYKIVAGAGEYNLAIGNVAANQTIEKQLFMRVQNISMIPLVAFELKRPANESSDFTQGDKLTYTLVVNNTGTGTARNVKVKIDIPKWLQYIDESTSDVIANAGEYTIDIGTIKPNEKIEKQLVMNVVMDRKISEYERELTDEELEALEEYEHDHGEIEIDEDLYEVLKINELTSESVENEKNTTIMLKGKVTADNIDGALDTSATNIIGKTSFNTTTNVQKESEILKQGDSFKYIFEISSSNSSETIENTVLEVVLPEEIEYQSAEVKNKNGTDITESMQVSYNKETRKLAISLGTIDDGANAKNIDVNLKAGILPNGVYDKNSSIEATVYGKDVNSRTIQVDPVEIGKVGFKVTQTSSIPANATISSGEDFTYTFTIENLSNIDVPELKITDVLPKELLFNKVTIKDGEGNITNKYDENQENNVEFTIHISAKEKITADVSVRALGVGENTKISNNAKVSLDGMEDITTNTITHTIAKFELYTEEGRNTPSVQGNKRIMGSVWIDKDSNGSKDEKEEVVADVDMLLFNNDTAKLVTDSEGNVLRAKTDKDGIYSFTNIAKGKYTVIFLYDTANYSATTYRKDGVNNDQNSDAVDSKITIDGVTRVAAITEEVVVNDNNVYNIDLGLVKNPKFDLKLEKTISKITVQDKTGTNVYEFNDTKLAKKELIAKNISGTTIIVEYKLKITNEGAIAGYVKKIADYMPSEMKFSSELNKDWYSSENGVLYNSSLANTQINPGESKEVTLILSKKMSENNLGLYHNEAEIYEAYNDLGLKDIDSVPGNKASTEDDFSNADVLISVKTGEVALFIGLSVSIIATITIAAYVIKKKVIR